MQAYNPQVEPNKAEWLEMPESDRINAVNEYHERFDIDKFEEDGSLEIHCTLHVIVENQVAMGVELIPETIAKLIRQGLDRHEAVHAIGAIISADIFNIMRGEKSEFSPKQYRKKLEKITAKRWRKGQF